ncbi:MAG: response regulator [Ancalomicrobiaceae bacterium]|nr:response regulator [Ancalomicrobiaceae bacterium]
MHRPVLTVGDSTKRRDMLAIILTGAGLDVVGSEEDFMTPDMLDRTSVDQVIPDINRPNPDGVTLVKHLRARPAHQSNPILTIGGGDDSKSEGRAAGAPGWIIRPFAPDELLQVVVKI